MYCTNSKYIRKQTNGTVKKAAYKIRFILAVKLRPINAGSYQYFHVSLAWSIDVYRIPSFLAFVALSPSPTPFGEPIQRSVFLLVV